MTNNKNIFFFVSELLTTADKIVFATALKADILEFLNNKEITESKKKNSCILYR